MMRKTLSICGLILLMLVAAVGTAAAQTGTEPSATPTETSTTEPTSEPGGTTSFEHPIVQILAAYFGRIGRPTLPTATPTVTKTSTETSTPEASVTPSATPTVTPIPGTEEFAEEIAKLHSEGLGFGVLVKLFAMAEASVKACVAQITPTPEASATTPAAGATTAATTEACVPVTVDELVAQFKGGMGMGQLFKEYGKPALLGVGQVKKAMKNLPTVSPTAPSTAVTSTPVPTQATNLQTQGKSNNGKGQGNKATRPNILKSHGRK